MVSVELAIVYLSLSKMQQIVRMLLLIANNDIGKIC